MDIPEGFSIQRFKWKNRSVTQLTLRALSILSKVMARVAC
ncbi:Unknown protein sequence [Pseudomonas syringae pv. maculicola]|nr:Unknown protein sequence [Pseudomonas syringae pv. maculicola]